MNRSYIFSSLMKAAYYILPALVLSVCLPLKANVPTPPTAPAPPAGYCQTINTELNTDLTAFNATLNSVWNGSKYPVLFAGNLPTANGNAGPLLISSTHFIGVQNQLLALQAMGHKAVMIEVGFPVLYQPFYSSQAEYQQYVGFYSQVAATIRAMGMKIVIENDVLLSNDIQAGWPNVSAFYSTLNWTQYQAARAQMAATVAQVIQPDYLVLGEEPDSEAYQSGQPNVNIAVSAAAMVSGEIAAVRALNLPNVKVGAGFGSWTAHLNDFISAYVALPLDYIDFHVYAINNVGSGSLIGNALTIASMAAAAGKPVAMSETWLWKMEDSEWQVLTPDQLRSREPFSFWGPTNTYFLQTMQNLANYTQMLYQAPSEPMYFNAYQTYGGTTGNGGAANCMCTTESCSATTIVNTETLLAATATGQSAYTATGIAYYNSLVSPADNTPPSTPINLTGHAVSTTATIFWNASTDDVGIAGYNVLRNGIWIANSIGPGYIDAGLSTSTTYNYQLQAFDLVGNTSLLSTTLALSTVYTIPPTTPTNVTAVPYSPKGITLGWSASQDPQGVSSYKIFRGSLPSNTVQVATVGGTTLSYKDNSLTPSTTYYYGVQATQASYISAMSAIVSATTLALPSAPTNLVATPVSGKQVKLTWTASTGGMPIASYHVLRGTSPSPLAQLATTTALSYTDNSVTASTTYYYEVQAYDTGGNVSPVSNEVSVNTAPLPNTPTGLAATAASAVKIGLSWAATVPPNGLPIASYQVSCGLAPGSIVKVATTLSQSYNYIGLSAGTTYYCAVLTADTAGSLSAMSAPVSATTYVLPNAPTNVVATANSSTRVTVTWTATTAAGGLPIGSYQIYRGTSPGSLSQVAIRPTASYIDTTVTHLATYYYAVKATDTGNDISPLSATTQVTIP